MMTGSWVKVMEQTIRLKRLSYFQVNQTKQQLKWAKKLKTEKLIEHSIRSFWTSVEYISAFHKNTSGNSEETQE